MSIQVPGYSIQRLIGKGGMASVYLATQQSLNRPVALNILNQFDNDTQIQRFFNEGKTIASLEQHNVITIHDLGEVNGRCFLAMEYLEGGDLTQRIKAGLSEDDALQLTALIARCLSFVHEKGVIHRDIKPENILFRKDGSPYYFSSEQARMKALDARTDIYSLGIMLYEMLTGERPFQGASPIEIIVAHLTTEAPPLPQHLARYQDLIDRMIAKEPDDRFDSAGALADELAWVQHATADKTPLKALVRQPVLKANDLRRLLNQSVQYPYIVLGLGAAAISAGAWLLYPVQPNISKTSENVAVIAADEPQPAPSEAEAKTKARPSAKASASQVEVRRLLAKGKMLLEKDKLTLSLLRQAHEIFDRAIKLDPKNIAALQGMARVKSLDGSLRDQIERHLAKAEQALRDFRLTSPARENTGSPMPMPPWPKRICRISNTPKPKRI